MCRCLDCWACEGVLADPFGEFMVQEDTVRSLPRVTLMLSTARGFTQ